MAARLDLAARAAALAAAGTPFVWATVVRAERPTSAKPGDSALVLADGQVDGFVGGDCAESTVRVQALEVLATGTPRLVRITPSPDDLGSDDLGRADEDGVVTVHNPCLSGGSLEIFLEPSVPLPVVAVYGHAPIATAFAAGPSAVWAAGPSTGEARTILCRQVLVRWSSPRMATTKSRCSRRHYERGSAYVALVASRLRGPAVLASLEVDERLR